MAVLYVRSVATADASLAAIFERSKFGMAIAAMIRIIATTISNSINEKPFSLGRIHETPFFVSDDWFIFGLNSPTTEKVQLPFHWHQREVFDSTHRRQLQSFL